MELQFTSRKIILDKKKSRDVAIHPHRRDRLACEPSCAHDIVVIAQDIKKKCLYGWRSRLVSQSGYAFCDKVGTCLSFLCVMQPGSK